MSVFAQPLDLLISPMPDDRGSRLLVLALRRMGAQGLHDAPLAHHFMTTIGKGFRRPLIMTRLLVTELSAASSGPIQIAPCCCLRLTASERALVDAAGRLPDTPQAAQLLLADLLGTRHADGAFASLAAVSDAYFDAGMPIGGWR